ncbi:hypothetical protein [Pedobacter sp. CFBP9032]|uniref:hypothetical protein n=1 Tax=Pedobacter sp. CFBP9032 TaxID=3096539 RepID=UPI002A699D0A|nr:hypothetical protein [Pedobacter sp. CFBP9032]MDY0905466.1 hypothetical protein [Pedobacter sp. CFBP9032]
MQFKLDICRAHFKIVLHNKGLELRPYKRKSISHKAHTDTYTGGPIGSNLQINKA